MVGKMGERLHSLSPCRHVRGENLWENHIVSPRTSPHEHWGLGWMWVMMALETANAGSRASWGGQGHVEQPSASGDGYGAGPACGMGYEGGLGPIGGKRVGGTPAVLGDSVGVTEEG